MDTQTPRTARPGRRGAFSVKCQNCGINYDDSDKECPMCGTKSGHRGRLSAPRYTGYNHKEGAEPCSHETYTKKTTSAAPTVQKPKVSPAQQAAASRTTATLNGKPVKKKGGKAAGWVAVLIVVLLGLVPTVVESLSSHMDGLRYAIEDALDGHSYGDGYDYSDGFYEGLVDYPLLKGQWRIDRTDGGTVLLDVDGDDNYTLRISSPAGWSLEENGVLTLWEEDQSEGAYDGRYPPESYACYSLFLAGRSVALGGQPVPEALARHEEQGLIMLLVYHEIGAPEDSFILYDYMEENAPMFPAEPEQLVKVQGA